MWTDNETAQDFLNFNGIAKTVAEIIRQAHARPVSIGVSGAWGVGKSSMIKLIRKELSEEQDKAPKTTDGDQQANDFIFVEFNAWLYQGYDDARAALIEVVASTLAAEAERRKTAVDKAKDLLARVNWFRAMKLATGSAASIALGLPPPGFLGELWGIGKNLIAGQFDKDDLGEVKTAAEDGEKTVTGLLKPKKVSSPPKEIEALRSNFEDVLKDMGVTLVVLIDDLDRCLPETTISTLEAIRLLLFLEHTAFVIAADDEMIKHAVKRHFQGVDDDLVVNYFDKLIQVPIRVPPLGTQEVRAYMMMLFVENSGLELEERERIRSAVCAQLGLTWQGKRVDLRFIRSLNDKLPDELIARLDVADRLAPLMTSATGIAGNPRLIKRFLNALSIRMSMSRAQGVGVDESELAKVLLFERCGNPKAYLDLIKAVTESDDGKPAFLLDWEQKSMAGETVDRRPPWDDSFITEWLRLPPQLGGADLRGALYVSREHAPLITPEDRLSAEAADLLEALLEHPEMAGSIRDRLVALPRSETSVIMDRLLGRARQEQEWGAPPILDACMAVAAADAPQGARLSGFLKERPAAQIKASIVPKIADEQWSKTVFDAWNDDDDVAKPVKNAIKARRGSGNVAIK
ncbi:KAP family P-loop domain protein [Caballeronia sordidicola]|uniref:KAP family P-loop domain protein n=1 Tax=Caballeronia sordidicola TaxID=196367 RepID=A0A158ESB7_CABSO|nr:P-loop NTPase fold protein [Caballeronia sordidicola]SAL09540.1 KAP family P-loop domain protein [Caballeronia sordidicola]